MKLIPLPINDVLTHPSLPFPLYGQDGRRLLAANVVLDDPRLREKLRALGVIYVQPLDYDAWRRGVERAVSKALSQNRPLSQLAKARPELVESAIPGMVGEEWEDLVFTLNRAVQAPELEERWLEGVREVRERARELTARRMDEALFYYFHTGGSRLSLYSSRQALRCMLVAGEAARELKWDDERIAVLDMAALTMNVAAWQLQDRLVHLVGRIEDPADRSKIATHPAEGARLLQASGVTDEVWLESVRLHHDDTLAERPQAELTPGQEIALLLRRVDRYCAMLSRRAGREPLSAVQAAQYACLGTDGKPDPIGSLMLKAIGLYPPGTYVALISREKCVVLERGERANQPVVAALTNSEGMVMAEPRLRYTSQAARAVRTALSPDQILVEPDLAKVKFLYAHLRSR